MGLDMAMAIGAVHIGHIIMAFQVTATMDTITRIALTGALVAGATHTMVDILDLMTFTYGEVPITTEAITITVTADITETDTTMVFHTIVEEEVPIIITDQNLVEDLLMLLTVEDHTLDLKLIEEHKLEGVIPILQEEVRLVEDLIPLREEATVKQ